jgi:hypothetical protein
MAFVSPANKIAQLASIHFRVGFPDKGTATMKVFLLLLSIAAFSAPALSAVGFEQFSVPDPARKPLANHYLWRFGFRVLGGRFPRLWDRFNRWWSRTAQCSAPVYRWF